MIKKSLNFILGNKKLSPSEKLTPATVIVIVIIVSLVFLRPVVVKAFEIQKQIKEKKELLTSLTVKQRILTSYQHNDGQLELDRQLQLITSYLPSTKPSLQTLLTLVTLARGDQLQFSGLTLSPGKIKSVAKNAPSPSDTGETVSNTDPAIENFTISFSVVGSKSNLESFVAKIKEVSPMMRIERFSTSFLSDERVVSDNVFMSADLELKIYYQKMPSALQSVEKPMPALTTQEQAFLQALNNYLFSRQSLPTVESVGQGGIMGNPNPFGAGPTD